MVTQQMAFQDPVASYCGALSQGGTWREFFQLLGQARQRGDFPAFLEALRRAAQAGYITRWGRRSAAWRHG